MEVFTLTLTLSLEGEGMKGEGISELRKSYPVSDCSYNNAMGLTGEPVTLRRRSGARVSMNS